MFIILDQLLLTLKSVKIDLYPSFFLSYLGTDPPYKCVIPYGTRSGHGYIWDIYPYPMRLYILRQISFYPASYVHIFEIYIYINTLHLC